MTYKCQKCKKILNTDETYEYRGAYSCDEHFDEVIAARDYERQEIIAEESAKTEIFGMLSIDQNCPIGRSNREILKGRIEVAKKESRRLKIYEDRQHE